MGAGASPDDTFSKVPIRGAVEVQYKDLLMHPISRGIIPVLVPVAYSLNCQRIEDVDADDVVLALARELVGLNEKLDAKTDNDDDLIGDKQAPSRKSDDIKPDDFKLHRIVLLDPSGGLPSVTRQTKSHVFVNLEQEYEEIRSELSEFKPDGLSGSDNTVGDSTAPGAHNFSVFGASNPISRFVEAETRILQPSSQIEHEKITPDAYIGSMERHVKNLDLLKQTLALLPPDCSALLTTPQEAATFLHRDAEDAEDAAPGVGTRRARNPLIFNLLTDKPLISSSLPPARLGSDDKRASPISMQSSVATFVKRGMPLTIIPDPNKENWRPRQADEKPISLEDPRIDFPRLLNLIEDSFSRPLDVDHYLSRIQNKIAGIIVAGEYEGGAILTWELPPGVPDDGSESSRQRRVPYLDKFAVLKRSQGAGGVADMVFSAMVRSCLPSGVCWRSRKDNKVNSWYFERSEGVWKLPDAKWTMFWTTKNLTNEMQRWKDYESVCRSILPSWADNKHIVD